MATIKSGVFCTDETDADVALTDTFQPIYFSTPVNILFVDNRGGTAEGNVEISYKGVLRNFSVAPGQFKVIDIGFATSVVYVRHNGTAVNTWEIGSSEA